MEGPLPRFPLEGEPMPDSEAVTERLPEKQGAPLSPQQQEIEQSIERFFAQVPWLDRAGSEARVREIVTKQKMELAAEIAPVVAKEAARRNGVMAQLGSAVKTRFGRFAVIGGLLAGSAGTGAGVGGAIGRHARGEENPQDMPAEKTVDVPKPEQPRVVEQAKEEPPLPAVDVDVMDKLATPERVKRILDHSFPKDWVRGEVDMVIYSDRKGFPIQNKKEGKKKSFAIAEADEKNIPFGGTTIRYFSGSQKNNRWTNFSRTLSHEISHANDWIRDGQMTPEEREVFHAKVRARIDAPDRFMSAYVESIDVKSVEQRTVEYWAEIGEAYFNAYEPEKVLSQADLTLVRDRISATDPHFDNRAALAVRGEVIRDMRWQAVRGDFRKQAMADGGTEAEVDATETWLQKRFGALKVTSDQSADRYSLASKVAEWVGTDRARRGHAESVLGALRTREELLTAVSGYDDLSQYKQEFSDYRKAMRRLRARASEEDVRFQEEVTRFVEDHDVVLGAGWRGGWLQSQEAASLEAVATASSAEPMPWVEQTFGWGDAEHKGRLPEIVVTVYARQPRAKRH